MREIRIVHEAHRQSGERRLDAFALVAGHHDDRLRARGQRLLGGDAHERLAADLGEELVRSAHAGRAAGGQHDGGNAMGSPRAGSSRGCGRVTISISRPPTPMPVMASRGTSSPARSRISTQSKPFSFGERAQPGAPSTGRPRASAEQQQIARIDRHAEMLDPSADRLDRGRDDIAPVGDGGRAEHDDELGAFAQHLLDRLRERALARAARAARRRCSRPPAQAARR